MVDPNEPQGSNAEVAQGGLNPESAYAELDRATERRLAMEAHGVPGAGMRGQGGPSTGAGMTSGAPYLAHGAFDADPDAELRANVTERLRTDPGGKGAAFGREEPPDEWLAPRS